MSDYKFYAFIDPLLQALKELGGSARPSEVCAFIAKNLALPESVLAERLKNGVSKFENQVHWARFYLAKAEYIDSSRHGVWLLTEKGQKAPLFTPKRLRELVQTVNKSLSRSASASLTATMDDVSVSDHDEETMPALPRETHRVELLGVLKSLSPSGFERLCQRLLREAGFEEVVVTGRSRDGGIDGHGVLLLNPFVSFRVYFQCKRYEGSVGSDTIRDFRGALMGRADKGIILTTGSFTGEAKREAVRDGVPPIELVDGERLLEMFEKFELGLKPRITYDLDTDFFKSFGD
jgi:restriction system protein